MIWMQILILHPNLVLLALGRCILREFRDILRFILASVNMVMVRVCTLYSPKIGGFRGPRTIMLRGVLGGEGTPE